MAAIFGGRAIFVDGGGTGIDNVHFSKLTTTKDVVSISLRVAQTGTYNELPATTTDAGIDATVRYWIMRGLAANEPPLNRAAYVANLDGFLPSTSFSIISIIDCKVDTKVVASTATATLGNLKFSYTHSPINMTFADIGGTGDGWYVCHLSNACPIAATPNSSGFLNCDIQIQNAP
jgi:hypothetical protein